MRLESDEAAPRPISLTPLIDVVFILLIFFMLASSFLDWRAVDRRHVQIAPLGQQEGDHRRDLIQLVEQLRAQICTR